MSWDEEKDTFAERPDVPANQKITSAEWNEHVSDQKDHSARHESGGTDEISVGGLSGDLADAQDPKVHNDTHGYDSADELATALRYKPQSEPTTPTSGCVRWYDNTDEAYKAKFDDGSVITLGER